MINNELLIIFMMKTPGDAYLEQYLCFVSAQNLSVRHTKREIKMTFPEEINKSPVKEQQEEQIRSETN